MYPLRIAISGGLYGKGIIFLLSLGLKIPILHIGRIGIGISPVLVSVSVLAGLKLPFIGIGMIMARFTDILHVSVLAI